jgi:hemolysin III
MMDIRHYNFGRDYTASERRVDAIIHVAGVLFAINGGLWLLCHVSGLNVVTSVSIYCFGLFTMLSGSAAYNLWPGGLVKEWLRRFDHAAIFVMIAATYTPFAMNRLQNPAGALILGLIWLGATVGVVLKLLFPRRFEVPSLALYLGLGWLIVTVIRPLSAALAAVDFWLLIAGGIVDSAGVVFYVLERLPYHKVVWHALVLVAATLHFAAIASEFAV